MSDKQKVLLTLALISQTCAACLVPLNDPPLPQPSPPAEAVLRKDFLSLLTLIYTSATKVSLTLRPPEAAYSACLAPLQDIAKHVSALTTCATLFDSHGLTLAKQVRQAAKDVLQSVQAYSQAFKDITERGDASAEDYLVRTGAVHDSVEQVRRDLPTDNLAAVRFLWAKDREMLEDSLSEVNDMIEDDGVGDDDFDDEDDEWDELGLGSSKKMSEVELARTKKIQPLLRMAVLLHKRIHIDLLKRPPKEVKADTSQPSIDELPGISHAFLLSVEELVAAFYAPQDEAAVRSAVLGLTTAAQSCRPALEAAHFLRSQNTAAGQEPIDDLQTKLADLAVSDAEALKKQRETQKWFDTCFGHVSKLSQSALSGLETP